MLSAFAVQQYEYSSGGGGAGAIVVLLVELVIAVVLIASMWKVFTKAGEPGWAAIVPIYNMLVMLKIAGKPGWWFILMLIPFVNAIIGILVAIAIAQRFGKSTGYGIGLAFLPIIFYPMLGFGDAQFQGGAPAK
jgi:hypothetical protein